jgi:hypothetical protein
VPAFTTLTELVGAFEERGTHPALIEFGRESVRELTYVDLARASAAAALALTAAASPPAIVSASGHPTASTG